ncbi:MAG: type IV pili twitching motility protein PilT [Candidatus Yanofskybacteria bacterium CG10_big_fil_rev_8_21_14_0_10_46_23]|uniref:Type IV pili twitching motility protein PilT n=1 Tax=Candidatus Yanofskybacteria bacterium CG10_big_fil_rev_8_21_14_0_10_46_23 TaxID=1975098 RepID=A0A2H0R5G6_9BACT|nr:MAG: type IV pili twitching motility protein PilT [Candidatus Yanofskybacteria bacterium CG10_big_fil_rev_8_21_14_0_10_46_23]
MIDFKKNLEELLLLTAQEGASDLHLSPGVRPTLRINSKLVPLTQREILDPEALTGLVGALINDPARIEAFKKERELDFSYVLNGARFRVNVYHTNGIPAATCRYIPTKIRTLEELNIPAVVKTFSRLSQGFVLVVGPTGHGKSTTLAAIIDLINKERAEKVVTIEDPIEYIFTNEKSIIDQREVGSDTDSFQHAIRSAFRENINVLLVGELRDHETMSAAVTAAETGHLVLTSIHTNSAAQTIERIVDTFPPSQQNQIIAQLANTLSGVVSQRLIPGLNGGLVPAVEVMFGNTAIRNLIREHKFHQINLAIETGQDDGMISLNRSLADLVHQKLISLEQAKFYSLNPKELDRLI